MKIRLKKEEFEKIEDNFKVLLETPSNTSALTNIEHSLATCFDGYTFFINIVGTDEAGAFYMSVYPEVATTNKMVESILSGHDEDVVNNLWKSNKTWTVEIDKRILSGKFNEKELTAMLLHEIGHISCTNSIPSKAFAIIQYSIAKQKFNVKSVARASIFRPVLSLPILDACILDKKRSRSSIREEIKADKFVKKLGYSDSLLSALNKVTDEYKLGAKDTVDKSMADGMRLPLSTIADIEARKYELAKNRLRSGVKYFESVSPFFSRAMEDAYMAIAGDENSSLAIGGRIEKVINDNLNNERQRFMNTTMWTEDAGEYVTEFFNFGKKYLKRIPPEEIYYIKFKTREIANENDRLMMLTYLYSKLDTVNYYISILNDPKNKKKLIVPYTMDELQSLKKTLMGLHDEITTFKIPMRRTHLMVQWPDNYEG